MTVDDMSKPLPPPPGSNRAIADSIPVPPGLETRYEPMASPPSDPAIETADGRLDEHEVAMILRTSLTPTHHRDPVVLKFIQSYMACRDVGQASMEAGIKVQSGKALRARQDIHTAITRLTEKSLMKYGFDAEELVEKIKEVVNIDPIELENPDGSFKKLKDMPPEVRRAIKKLKVKNMWGKDPNGMPIVIGEIIEYELYDKLKAGEMLGSEKDLFKKTTTMQHDVTDRMASVLLGSQQRGSARAQQFMKDVTPNRLLGEKKSG